MVKIVITVYTRVNERKTCLVPIPYFSHKRIKLMNVELTSIQTQSVIKLGLYLTSVIKELN
jgi:hypothetical protein